MFLIKQFIRNPKLYWNHIRQYSSNKPYLNLTGGEIIEKKLLEKDVDHIFLYSGGAIMPAIDPFAKSNISCWQA